MSEEERGRLTGIIERLTARVMAKDLEFAKERKQWKLKVERFEKLLKVLKEGGRVEGDAPVSGVGDGQSLLDSLNHRPDHEQGPDDP